MTIYTHQVKANCFRAYLNAIIFDQMKTTNLFLVGAALLAVIFSGLKAEARILSIVPSALLESSEVKFKGRDLTSVANPFKAKAVTENGQVVDLPVNVNLHEDRRDVILVTLPSIDSDIKVLLKLSGGDIPETSPQEFVVLIIDKPEAFGGGGTAETPVISGGASGAQGPVGPTGPQGPSGPSGSTGPQGPQGPGNKYGGTFEINSFPVKIVLDVLIGGNVVANDSNLLKIVDSDTGSTLNVIGTISGATAGQTLSLLFATPAVVINNETTTANSINLSEFDPLGLPYRVNYLFNVGDTLKLIFDGTSWYELSRSHNFQTGL